MLSQQGDLDGAIAPYERALAIDGSRARAGGNLGMALMRAGRFEEARPLLEQALAANRYVAELQAAMRPIDATQHETPAETTPAPSRSEVVEGGLAPEIQDRAA